MDELVYWIWLSLCCTPDTATFPSLIQKFDSAKAIYDAPNMEISSCLHPRSLDKTELLKRDLERSEDILKFCQKHGVGIVTYADSAYPQSLRSIPTPPVLLYYRGKFPNFNKGIYISVVGTRRLSDYGRKHAFAISRDLATAGATIVSGMAIGIDGVAHAGAISADSPTVAVLGSGIDVCYPSIHLKLAREIVKNGCVITEFAPGTEPNKYNFPRRNRIISGISSATVVIEGSEKSGSIITARHAKAQGRTVYALPGNVGTENAQVSNLLIKNGATLITAADDIVRDYSEGRIGDRLNPFKLEQKMSVDMFEVLTRLNVSCVAPSDQIFKPKFNRKNNNTAIQNGSDEQISLEAEIQVAVNNDESVAAEFNADILEIYKRIPTEGECTVDSLVGGKFVLKDIMRALLKLEVGRFVTLLPGERVKRNLK